MNMLLPRLRDTSSCMGELDRVGWTAGFSFRAYGLRIGIRSNDEAVIERAQRRLPFGSKPASSPVVDSLYSVVARGATDRPDSKRFSLLYFGAQRLFRTKDMEEMLRELEIDLHGYVASATRQRTFLHAGVVGWRGRAIVIPGKNFSGKTRLVTALVRAGATYYADEFAVLDTRGRVHPYPWVLHIREEGLDRPRECPIEQLGGRAGRKPLPVGLVVLSEYRQGAKWRPRRLSQGQATLAMMANVMSVRQRLEDMRRALRHVVSDATVLQGVRGEADEAVDSLLSSTYV